MIDATSSERIVLNGSCHCGAVRFTVDIDRGLRLGTALHLLDLPDAGRRRSDLDSRRVPDHPWRGQLATYRFNTKTARHHFCSDCGIYTHHKRRSDPNQLGINVACLDGVSPFDFRDVIVHDGERHPSDNAEHKSYVAGVLRLSPGQRVETSP